MKRLDWLLVPPANAAEDDSAQLAAAIAALVAKASEELLSEAEVDHLVALEARYDAATVSPCDAVGAPRVQDDPDWEGRVVDEYADGDYPMELEEFLDLRRDEPDCERCPYASPYSLYPLDPCEWSAGPLLALFEGTPIAEQARQEMDPARMIALAEALSEALRAGPPHDVPFMDVADYLKTTLFFLRFWAGHGFGVRPEAPDELAPIVTSDDDAIYDEPSDPNETPLLH